MLSAFQSRVIIELKAKDKVKVESILTFEDRVLVGLNNGTLRIYRNAQLADPERQDVKANEPDLLELVQELDKFSKRPIQQLATLGHANLLVSLFDAHVWLHNVETFSLEMRLDKTKGATLFAVTSNAVDDLTSAPEAIVSRLAVAVKRRILVWTWKGGDLDSHVSEIAMPSTVKSLNWSKDEKIIVGMDTGFSLVDTHSMGITEILKPDQQSTGEALQTAGTRFGAVNTTGMSYVGLSGWVPKPMATNLGQSQILLAKDVNTLFIENDGKALDRRQIPWSGPPEALDYSRPYLVSLQSSAKGALDIRNPDTSTLLQTISLPNASLIQVSSSRPTSNDPGPGFLVASDRCVWRLSPASYEAQIDQLVEADRYEEAVSLLGLLTESDLNDKQGLLREVQTKKAQGLFSKRKYQAAMDLLAEAGAPPAKVIGLYPKSIAGDSDTSEHKDGSESTKKADQLDETHRAILASSPETPRTSERASSATDSAHFENAEDLKTAVIALCGFLAQSRVQIQRYINTDGSLKVPVHVKQASDAYKVPFANLLSLDRDIDFKKIDWSAELLRVANLVDTTLFRAYMHARPQLAGPLFRLDNFCDPHVVEEKLYESGRYTDLVDFLHGKKLHQQALELLEKFGRNDAAEEVMPALRGPGRTVAYLQQLSPDDTDLILEFAKWPLQLDPDLGMEVFLADTENAEQLPRHRVVEFLKAIDGSLATIYLEHIVLELEDQDPAFHQDLVDEYLSLLTALSTAFSKKDREKKSDYKSKLENLLRSSTQYNKGKTFRQLPANNPDYFESRAIVLSAMGNHKQALSIYVYQLQDHAKAEEYCMQLHLVASPDQVGDHSSEADEIYTVLLSLYLRPPQGQSLNWPQALDLLSKHGARLPANETLNLAPDDLAVAELASYFQGRMRTDTSILATGRIVAGLEDTRRTRSEQELLGLASGRPYSERGSSSIGITTGSQGRSRKVVIKEDSHCKICLRRFGNSAVKVFPDNVVVHYGCAGKAQEKQT